MSAVMPTLPEVVGGLLDAVDGIVPAAARHDLEQACRRLEEQRLNLVVLGEFKRGKSTLVNALLGAEIVPTGVLPLTAAVIVVRHGGAPRLLIDFENGGHHESSLDEVADFATEAGNPENRRGVRLVTIELAAPLLAQGIQLVDTPGIGSVFAHNTETALGFLGQVDAGLFVLAADQPLSAAEEGLVREAAERLPRIFFVLNKIDRVEEAEHEEAAAFVRHRLADVLGGEPDMYGVSAATGEGLEALGERLTELAASEREHVLTGSVRSLAAAFAAEALQAVRFEAHATELPVAELERRVEEFRERAAELERTREEAAELLLQAAKRLVREQVDGPLLSLAHREGDELLGELRAAARDRGSVAAGRLAAALEDWMRERITKRFDGLVADYEQSLAHELLGLNERYVERVERIMRELDDAAADIFGERIGRLVEPVSLRRPSRFTFKLHEVEREILDQLASSAAASVPGALGRRLVLRQAEERLRILLDRHAGRLRSDLAARVQESVREHARELASGVRDAVDAVEAAVDRAVRDQQSGRARVAARMTELRQVERRVTELAAVVAGAGE